METSPAKDEGTSSAIRKILLMVFPFLRIVVMASLCHHQCVGSGSPFDWSLDFDPDSEGVRGTKMKCISQAKKEILVSRYKNYL
jgi:hypothetical protein